MPKFAIFMGARGIFVNTKIISRKALAHASAHARPNFLRRIHIRMNWLANGTLRGA